MAERRDWHLFMVRTTPSTIAALDSDDPFQHISPLLPAFKLHRGLHGLEGSRVVTVHLDRGQDLDEVLALIQTFLGPDNETGFSGFEYINLELDREQLVQLARRHEVRWIEPAAPFGFSDERHALIVAGRHDGASPKTTGNDYVEWLEDKGFCTSSGSGCISYSTRVAVFDSGTDYNTCFENEDGYIAATGECTWAPSPLLPHHLHHEDFGSREDRFFCLDTDLNSQTPSDCYTGSAGAEYHYDFSGFNDHGTFVASIIVGDPILGTYDQDPSDYFSGTGIAPLARLMTAKLDNFAWAGEADQAAYALLVKNTYSAGATFGNNSWNCHYEPNTCTTPGVFNVTSYNVYSRLVDQFVRDADGFSGDSPDSISPMTLVFSAGNRPDAGFTNECNPLGAVIAPGNAKNIISVGATRGWELQSEGRGCCGANDPLCQTIRIDDIKDYSTRGVGYYDGATPVWEDRFKPDLVAPGWAILAAQRCEFGGSDDGYGCFEGTSAAAPHVTGSAILLDAWYNDSLGSHPSPAMIKAILVTHADDLSNADNAEDPGVDHGDNGSDIPPSPSIAQGWGRVNLDGALDTTQNRLYFDEDHDPTPTYRFDGPGSWTLELDVANPAEDVLITLAFTDAAGTLSGSSADVNGVSIKAVDDTGVPRTAGMYWANDFVGEPKYSRRRGVALYNTSLDWKNNVQVIRIPAGAIYGGDFTLTVFSSKINQNAVPGLDNDGPNQDFALYIVNATEGT
jgi:hypothetical protein